MPPHTPIPGNTMDYLKSIAEIRKLFAAADYAGVKNVATEDDLEQFLFEIFSCRTSLFQPDPPVQSFADQPDGAPCRPVRRIAVRQVKDLQG